MDSPEDRNERPRERPGKSPEIDPEGMRRRLDAALEKDLLGEPLTEQEKRIVQYVRYASRAARPVDPRIQVKVNRPRKEAPESEAG